MAPKSAVRYLIASIALLASFAVTAGATARTAPIGTYTTHGAWSFYSEPKLHPPKLSTDMRTRRGLARGSFLVANFPNLGATQPTKGKAKKMIGQSGPLILDQQLKPVWFLPVPTNVVASNLKAQTFEGKPALSWWQGVVTRTGQIKSGQYIVVNQSYRTVAKLEGADGWVLTLHDMQIKGDDAWVTANKNVKIDLTPYGGNGMGTVVDVAVQEYDLKTGQLLYTWDALQHVSLADTYQPAIAKVPWDPYHINSVQYGKGTFLVSLRNTWAAYQVDVATSAIQWTLGGRHSTFKIAKDAQFQWQHDVEYHRGGLVSMFDDHCCKMTGPGKFAKASAPGRGLVLKLDTSNDTATMVAQYVRKPPLFPEFLGNTNLLPNGNVTIGYGSLGYFTEFGKTGKQLLDAVWPYPDLSYRAYTSRWTGKPYFAPSLAVRTSHGKATAYASWDGSTELAGWRVLAGASGKHLSPVARVRKNGFETAIALKRSYKAYEVQALDSRGHVLSTSAVFPKPKGGGGGFY